MDFVKDFMNNQIGKGLSSEPQLITPGTPDMGSLLPAQPNWGGGLAQLQQPNWATTAPFGGMRQQQPLRFGDMQPPFQFGANRGGMPRISNNGMLSRLPIMAGANMPNFTGILKNIFGNVPAPIQARPRTGMGRPYFTPQRMATPTLYP